MLLDVARQSTMTLAAVLLLMLIGFAAGTFGALAGVGGGIIVTPLLAIYFGLPMHQAIGVTLLVRDCNFHSHIFALRGAPRYRCSPGHDAGTGHDRGGFDRSAGRAPCQPAYLGNTVCLFSSLQRRLDDQKGLEFAQ